MISSEIIGNTPTDDISPSKERVTRAKHVQIIAVRQREIGKYDHDFMPFFKYFLKELSGENSS